jgi:nitrite reductase/ring-hydroxylating ferredoxin subunit
MDISAADHAAFSGRANRIDHAAANQLHYLGNYVRDISSNLTRMMENAHDWEHLPFVHPSSFAAIAPIETGTWGWRCKTALPNAGGEQLLELLVDEDRHYWATSVVSGSGQGIQIHTQASDNDGGGITVDVRFYLPQPPENEAQAAMILGYLQTQYTTLYDEDEALMRGRQEALDERKALRGSKAEKITDLGPEAALDRTVVHTAQLGNRRIAVRYQGNAWIAHAARCPHALGPLDTVEPDMTGHITCPWHGYRFDLLTGAEEEERCGALALYRCAISPDRRLEVFEA